MQPKTVEELIEELVYTYKNEIPSPFPYADCRKLLKTTSSRTKRYTGLIPDLDLYFAKVAGYCSWKKKILRWSEEKLKAVQEELALTFLETHPQYKILFARMTVRAHPRLYARLALTEQVRNKLLTLISLLLERIQNSAINEGCQQFDHCYPSV